MLLSVYTDYTAVSAESENASNDGIILESYCVSIESSALAIDAFKKACEENNITYTATQSQFGELKLLFRKTDT